MMSTVYIIWDKCFLIRKGENWGLGGGSLIKHWGYILLKGKWERDLAGICRIFKKDKKEEGN